MGSTASHGLVTQHADLAATTNSNTPLTPNLICEPGGTCGTKTYMEKYVYINGHTLYIKATGNSDGVLVGVYVVGVVGGGVLAYATESEGLNKKYTRCPSL
jgi:D-serine dehydratase